MFSLILVVISIALVVALAAASISHIPASAMLRQVLFKEANVGIRQVQGAMARYFEMNRDADGVVAYPGSDVDMAPLIAPAYGFMPARVRNILAWETRSGYLYGHPAVYLCIKPTVSTKEGPEALSQIKVALPVQSAFLGSTCGATSDVVGGTHLSVWMILAHYNGPRQAPAAVVMETDSQSEPAVDGELEVQ